MTTHKEGRVLMTAKDSKTSGPAAWSRSTSGRLKSSSFSYETPTLDNENKIRTQDNRIWGKHWILKQKFCKITQQIVTYNMHYIYCK